MTTKEDWIGLTDQEDGELFCLQLIEDVILKSQTVLFEKRIDGQVLPFAVNFCKQQLLELVRFKYYKQDDLVDPSLWIPDTEPQNIPLDSWARASCPIKHVQRENSVKRIAPSKNQSRLPSASKQLQTDTSIPVLGHLPVRPVSGRSTPAKHVETKASAQANQARLVQEENKRILARIYNLEREGNQDFTYDLQGRIIQAQPPIKTRLPPQNRTKEPSRQSKAFVADKRKQVDLEEYILDTIHLQSNVVLKQGASVKKGPQTKKYTLESGDNQLQPLESDIIPMRPLPPLLPPSDSKPIKIVPKTQDGRVQHLLNLLQRQSEICHEQEREIQVLKKTLLDLQEQLNQRTDHIGYQQLVYELSVLKTKMREMETASPAPVATEVVPESPCSTIRYDISTPNKLTLQMLKKESRLMESEDPVDTNSSVDVPVMDQQSETVNDSPPELRERLDDCRSEPRGRVNDSPSELKERSGVSPLESQSECTVQAQKNSKSDYKMDRLGK
ncbi:hypothetical protein EDD86DRAFT_249980 [Gorgonomyces haynaldii]|nr:hypothetical protein EDD86DRAFT_249980 [Gorgonomyces haynaldii]